MVYYVPQLLKLLLKQLAYLHHCRQIRETEWKRKENEEVFRFVSLQFSSFRFSAQRYLINLLAALRLTSAFTTFRIKGSLMNAMQNINDFQKYLVMVLWYIMVFNFLTTCFYNYYTFYKYSLSRCYKDSLILVNNQRSYNINSKYRKNIH